MNKKIIGLFTISLIVILTMGAVSAANLESHNFDGYFSMKVPKDMTFEKEDDSTIDEEMKLISLSYLSDSLVVFYWEGPIYSNYSSYYYSQLMFQGINPDLTKCYESQEDNLRILEPTTNDDVHFAIVGTNSDNKQIFLAGQDVSLLKEMGHSIEFN